MTENSSPTAPAPRSWLIPALVALVVLAIVVVVTVVVRHGDDDSADPATGSSSTPASTDNPSDSSSSSPAASDSTSSAPTTAPPSVLPGVDLDGTLKKALKAKFPALIPSEVPAGWTLTDVSWNDGLWVLDFAVPGGETAQVFQTVSSEQELVGGEISGAQSAGTVNLKKFGTGVWNAYQGDRFGLAHQFGKSWALVVAADKDTAVTIAQQLLTAEDGQLTDDD